MQSSKLRIFYAGDSDVGGAANYLLGVLKDFAEEVIHVPPAKTLKAAQVKNRFNVFIFSDYPCRNVGADAEKNIISQIESGAGVLMVGGWASFSGPSGGWRGSKIEKTLPVNCQKNDDRINFSGGAYPVVGQAHPILEGLSFRNPPAVCGLNDIHPKQESQVILNARKIVSVGNNLTLDPVNHPLLVVNTGTEYRSAAYASDFAPHWCGGFVDWGSKRVRLPVTKQIQIEVSDSYQAFIRSLIMWLASREKS